MKRFALLLAAALPVVALAESSNTVTFRGQVTAQTCSVSINGNAASPVVLMPTVNANALAVQGSTAGETPFTIEVNGCSAPAVDLSIKTAFVGNNVNNAGHMLNAGTATDVQVELLDKVGGTPVRLDGVTAVEGLLLLKGATSARHEFAVRYISEKGGAKPGTVSASAQYALDYL